MIRSCCRLMMVSSLFQVAFFSFAQASPFRATSGLVTMSLDAEALGSLNFGIDPAIPTLVLEHFFDRAEAETLTRNEILAPPYATTNLPDPSSLVHQVTGAQVTNPAERGIVPTSLLIDTLNVRDTWSPTEVIGTYGAHRFIGDFGVPFGSSPFVWGDFHIAYDAQRNLAKQTGFYVQNNFDIPIPLFEVGSPVLSGNASVWTLEGDLLLAPEVAAAFFFGDDFRKLGTIQVHLRAGDVDLSGQLEAADIDAIAQGIRSQSSETSLDVNGDSQVTEQDRLAWTHDIVDTYLGDANLDGLFDSADLVTVFAAGKYEDHIDTNAGWAEGDWDGDGDFTTTDLVVAFRDGGYDAGPRAAMPAVPEPISSSALALLSVCALIKARHRSARAHRIG